MSDASLPDPFQAYCIQALKNTNEEIDDKFLQDFMFCFADSEEPFPIPIEMLVEWGVYSTKTHAITALEGFQEGKEFSRALDKTSGPKGGRPRKQILLSIECFKSLCMLAKNDAGKQARSYYLLMERLWKRFMKEQFDAREKEKAELQNKLQETQEELEQQEQAKKSAMMELGKIRDKYVPKNMHRHKFQVSSCLYLDQDPAHQIEKYKFGVAKDINQRMRAHRTTCPNMKIRYMVYTEHNEKLENHLKEAFAAQLEQPAHEWVIAPLANVVSAVEQISALFHYDIRVEKELWKYNNEDPPLPTDPVPLDPIYTYNQAVFEVDERFLTRENWTEFVARGEDGLWACPIPGCDIEVKRKDTLSDHIQEQHFERTIKCSLCPKTFPRKYTLSTHMKEHSDDKPEPKSFRCDECGQYFTQKGGLNQHIKSIHLGIKHPCSLCVKIFSSKGSLNRHVTNSHPGTT